MIAVERERTNQSAAGTAAETAGRIDRYAEKIDPAKTRAPGIAPKHSIVICHSAVCRSKIDPAGIGAPGMAGEARISHMDVSSRKAEIHPASIIRPRIPRIAPGNDGAVGFGRASKVRTDRAHEYNRRYKKYGGTNMHSDNNYWGASAGTLGSGVAIGSLAGAALSVGATTGCSVGIAMVGASVAVELSLGVTAVGVCSGAVYD